MVAGPCPSLDRRCDFGRRRLKVGEVLRHHLLNRHRTPHPNDVDGAVDAVARHDRHGDSGQAVVEGAIVPTTGKVGSRAP